MNDAPKPSIFRDVLKDKVANSPVGWNGVADLFDDFAKIIKGDVLPHLRSTVRAGEEATAILFCAVLVAKQENIDLGFRAMVDQARGRSFGAKLINWVVSQMDADIAADLRVAWSGLHQHMSSAIEMMVYKLEPDIINGLSMTPAKIVDWIHSQGGMGQLHMDYMRRRNVETQTEKQKRERDRQAGAQARRLKEAQTAGFPTIETYDAHQAEAVKAERKSRLSAKFPEIKRRLVENGDPVRLNGKTELKDFDGRLFVVLEGRAFAVSDEDEVSLLSCAAAVI